MSASYTAKDVLEDIEFELAQGAITRDDLGQSIHAVKKYQSNERAELFAPGKKEPALREALARQFQLNDMLLMLLQEVAGSVYDFRLQLRRTAQLRTREPAVEDEEAEFTSSLSADQWRDPAGLRNAAATSLEPPLDVRPVALPVAGGLLQRVRYALHNLTLFYVHKLGREQRAVNNTFADWLLYQEALHRHQVAENDRLRRRILELEKRLSNTAADESKE